MHKSLKCTSPVSSDSVLASGNESLNCIYTFYKLFHLIRLLFAKFMKKKIDMQIDVQASVMY